MKIIFRMVGVCWPSGIFPPNHRRQREIFLSIVCDLGNIRVQINPQHYTSAAEVIVIPNTNQSAFVLQESVKNRGLRKLALSDSRSVQPETMKKAAFPTPRFFVSGLRCFISTLRNDGVIKPAAERKLDRREP